MNTAALPIYPAGHSWCAVELERRPLETWQARADAITRPGRIYPMGVYDCDFNEAAGEKPDRWLTDVAAEAISTLAAVPAQMRVVRVWGVHGSPDPAIGFSQVLHLRKALDNAGIQPVLCFVDSEEAYTGRFTRHDFWRSVCSPLACPIVLWNHLAADPSGKIPAQYWAGDYMGAPLAGAPSNPETYVGWYSPKDPEVAAGRPPGYNDEPAMFTRWIDAANSIRSALKAGECIPHLPVVHPDPVLARWYTEQTIVHARLAGVTRFFWASYMSDDASAMADTIAAALVTADGMARQQPPMRTRYVASAIRPDAREVITRGYRTRRPV